MTEKLKEHFPEVVNLTYTADVEGKLDLTPKGRRAGQGVLRPVYKALDLATVEMKASRIEPKMSDEKCHLRGADADPRDGSANTVLHHLSA